MPHIGDYKEKKKRSFASWYLLAGIVGVALFYFLLVFTKIISFILKFAVKHYIYFGIGVLILLILIRKLKKSKRNKKIEERNEYRYR